MEKSQKIVVILCDGMADYPDSAGNTPMTIAKKPNMDAIAAKSEVGLCATVPEGMKPGSDVANLSVMGYNPRECYTGRSPLEAISIGINLSDTDVTYRTNFVTLSSDGEYENKTMLDYSAGEISTTEAKQLISFLAANLPMSELKLYAGVSYRHCLVRSNGILGAKLAQPHDISDKTITEHLPSGEYGEQFLSLMKKSYDLLKNHPINIKRVSEGKSPANSVWFWGEGKKPALAEFTEKFGIKGAVISAVDLIKGIGLGAKMTSINVDGATGTLHTNFSGKAQAALDALKTHDYVYVHLEAPDECGHQGDRNGKIKAIELIDEKVIAPIFSALTSEKIPFKMLIIPDHATPLCLKTHTSDPVPYLIYNSEKEQTGITPINEFTAKQTSNFIECGYKILPKMLEK